MRFTGVLDKVSIKRSKDGVTTAALVLTAPATSDMMNLIRLSCGGSVVCNMVMVQAELAFDDRPADEHPPAPDPDEDDGDEDDDPDGDMDEDDDIDDERTPLEVVQHIQP